MAYKKHTVATVGQDEFLVTFPIDDHLCVTVNGVLSNLNDDYTVNQLEGTVVFGVAPSVGSIIELRRL